MRKPIPPTRYALLCNMSTNSIHDGGCLQNALLSVPDPNACIMKKCSVFQVEFVCRGFMTGEAYQVAYLVDPVYSSIDDIMPAALPSHAPCVCPMLGFQTPCP